MFCLQYVLHLKVPSECRLGIELFMLAELFVEVIALLQI